MEDRSHKNLYRVTWSFWVISLICLSVIIVPTSLWAQDSDGFTTDFSLSACKFKSIGENPYFILKPGYRLILQGEEDGETIDVQIIVLHETQWIVPEGIRPVRTRVVEEREWVDGELAEVSRNFYAICRETNSVYYFGEDVDIYEDGEIVSHEGAWRAGVDGALPGLMMPGTFLLGSRYYQEVAQDVAEDRAEHTAMGLIVELEAGTFEGCVEITETTPLDSGESTKVYCPGVGLISDDELELVSFGFAHSEDESEEEDTVKHLSWLWKRPK